MSHFDIPAGFRFAGLASGIKKSGKLDLALICSDQPAATAGVFTQNKVYAAPLQVTKPRIAGGVCQAVLINSGNANACTGEAGLQVAQQTSQLVAKQLNIDEELVALASTGVIGVQLPIIPFEQNMDKLVDALAEDRALVVAEAIMTTDAYSKVASARFSDGEKAYNILGLAKGAGMIHPNMATMLGFVLTDAAIDAQFLDSALRQAVKKSFNSITVDGDTSTNDTVLLLANGAAGGKKIEPGSEAAQAFVQHLERVLLDLAKMIVRDGEGATKLVEIKVQGAESEDAARTAAKSVATSSLVKTAFFGEDANWGRIISAVGYSGIDVDQNKIDIFFNQVAVTKDGLSTGPELEAEATEVLKLPEFTVTVELNQGDTCSSYYTSDLGYEYIKINADYRT
ncbi:glutamate N-acetyltransferase [Malonomonas rubra DSM 5091]|uniref:Arginine biosynthesis bifunctional protein ArgJ n=1 Tax=Malonomonas rubra DSM 5091 TaxID=1122189 RepID=A0A1M6BY41_MALRU|nr:bifunctional glutamate N-acetyltransferase/amino-acid acetyltransferase ArgJ [Malonomonas rubra]SHI53617.1 glutamate N-acetyltransferase [Malonomonas rubra DSM 5091]